MRSDDKIPPEQANETSKSFDDALLEVTWKTLESHYNRFKDIDAKAIGVITITGILITFLAKPVDNECLTKTFFVLTMMSFLVTIAFSVLVIRTRKYNSLSTEKLIEKLKNETHERKIGGIIVAIAAQETKMCEVSNAKAKDLRWAINCLGFSIIILIFYSVVSL